MRANRAPGEVDSACQLELFDDALAEPQQEKAELLVLNDRRDGSNVGLEALPIEPSVQSKVTGGGPHAGADRAVLRALEEALADARGAGDDRPTLVVLPSCLGLLGAPSTPLPAHGVSLRQAGDDWLRRLETQRKSESTLVGYRVAIDDLLDWSETNGRGATSSARPRSSITCTRTRSERNRRRRATTGASSSCASSCVGSAGATASPTHSSISMRRPSPAKSATG